MGYGSASRSGSAASCGSSPSTRNCRTGPCGPSTGPWRRAGRCVRSTGSRVRAGPRIKPWKKTSGRRPYERGIVDGKTLGSGARLRHERRASRSQFRRTRRRDRSQAVLPALAVRFRRHGSRRSLQFFDAHGTAVHKVYLTDASDVAAYERLIATHRTVPTGPSDDTGPLAKGR